MEVTETYTLSGLTCNGCAAKVKNEILKEPGISVAEISLVPQQAVISSNSKLKIAQLQQAVTRAGAHYHIHETSKDIVGNTTIDKPWLEVYKPLLLIFAFIAGLAMYGAFTDGAFQMIPFMRFFMAGFFLTFSFFKLLDLKGFATSYAMYDVLAAKWNGYGYVYPFLELALGISYLTGFEPDITNWATIIVMGFSTIGVTQSVLNKKKIKCACLGAVFNLPMSTVTIVEDVLMVGMAAVMIA